MQVLQVLDVILQPSFCLVGLIGNSMGILLLRTQNTLKHLPSSTYLVAMALFSCFFLGTLFGTWLDTLSSQLHIYSDSIVGCKLITYIGSCADFACVWFIVFVSADRFLLLWAPAWRLRLCSLRSERLLTITLVFLTLALNFWIILLATVVPGYGCSVSDEHLNLYLHFQWLETVLSFVVPSLLVAVANCTIIWQLHRFNSLKKQSLRVQFSSMSIGARGQQAAKEIDANADADRLEDEGSISTSSPQVRFLTNQRATLETPLMSNESRQRQAENEEKITDENPRILAHLQPTANMPSNEGSRVGQRATDRSRGLAGASVSIMATSAVQRSSSARRMRSTEIRLTKSLLVITTTFVLLNLPHYLVRSFLSSQGLWAIVVWHLAYQLYRAHHALIFFVYIFNSAQMRKQLKPTALKLLECYCLKTVPDFGH